MEEESRSEVPKAGNDLPAPTVLRGP